MQRMRTLNQTLSQDTDNSSQRSLGKPKSTYLPPSRTTSTTSFNGSGSVASQSSIDPPVLIYHESARSIVFRDHLRRAVKKEQEGNNWMDDSGNKRTVTTEFVTELADANRDTMDYVPPDDMIASSNKETVERNTDAETGLLLQGHGEDENADELDSVVTPLPLSSSSSSIANCFQSSISPLPKLALGPNDELQSLIDSATGQDRDVDRNWTEAEQEVVNMLANQQALVKTIKNTEWTSFLHRFQISNPRNQNSKYPTEHDDISPDDIYPFNSFVTSCSLLPPFGQKMRAYGSNTSYTVGVVFAMPDQHSLCNGNNNGNANDTTALTEDEAGTLTKTWSWPAGYSAKTEFNIDCRGNLINGRDDARVSLNQLREYNIDYVTKEDYGMLFL